MFYRCAAGVRSGKHVQTRSWRPRCSTTQRSRNCPDPCSYRAAPSPNPRCHLANGVGLQFPGRRCCWSSVAFNASDELHPPLHFSHWNLLYFRFGHDRHRSRRIRHSRVVHWTWPGGYCRAYFRWRTRFYDWCSGFVVPDRSKVQLARSSRYRSRS